ncbi:hypothetical protein F441_03530, partial [Phytophthora nicotianae CJ01A1]
RKSVSDNIILFQMTPKHPVNGNGIVNILDAVGLLADALAHPNRVNFALIRASDAGTSITCKQRFFWVSAADADQVSTISNQGDVKAEEFDRSNVTTKGVRSFSV